MTLLTPWEIEQTWGSHQPLLRGVLEVLRPLSAVECGCGNFSTPLLRSRVPELVTVEHDARWAEATRKKFPETPAHRWILHPIPARNGTDPAAMPEDDLRLLQEFYSGLAKSLPPYGFLFVDTYRCARVPAALALAPQADVVLLHDAEPSSRDFYRYHLLDAMWRGWHRYEHRPEGRVARTHALPWTALYSREPLPLEAMQAPIVRESMRLWGQEVRLERIDG